MVNYPTHEFMKAQVEALKQKLLSQQQMQATLSTLMGGAVLGLSGKGLGPATYLATGRASSKKGKPLPKETTAGPILAYRAWAIRPGTGKLWSIGIGAQAWPSLPTAATCAYLMGLPWQYHGHPLNEVPSSGCQCGWYAVKEKEAIPSGPKVLVGQVALWGKVVAHQKGYRAEYAYPVEVYVQRPMPGFRFPPAFESELNGIKANYGCKVVVR